MATYNQIQQWVEEKFGFTPKTCWIADMKEECGLPVRAAHNRQGKRRLHPCPKEKKQAIKAAFMHFDMM
jgi:hypothetical protein